MPGIFDLSDPEDRARSRELDAYLNAYSVMDDAEEKEEANAKVEAMSALLDDSIALEICNLIFEYGSGDKFETSLKSMLVSYHYSMNAYLKSDREQFKKDLAVFSKSFMNVCLGALEEYNKKV